MRILLIKMSSMGDVFHTFPALSDALQNTPGLVVDWVVESAFAEIPKWHPAVDKVYAIELRKWRKQPFKYRAQIKAFFAHVNQTHYDLVIDAQGLLKSAWVAKKMHAKTAGYDWSSAREPLATWFYHYKYPVSKQQHAIVRLRQLLAQCLGYSLATNAPMVYGLTNQAWSKPSLVTEQFADNDYWVFLHGTTWTTKYWPEDYWIELLQKANAIGKKVILPWGNADEHQRAIRISRHVEAENVWVPQAMLSLNDMAKTLKNAQAVVSVDTGLSHVAAALEVPMVVLYRVTDPKLVGADGQNVVHLCSPLATKYLKKFTQPCQENDSLQGLLVEDVIKALSNKLALSTV
ncbi:lipopolysaccharide heptosyltransferase I [Thiomicrorhabdus aquaedulcis]|uniref:lipopolysaccharide heptosyltransferase I n=1 Tax=Thiomicrorhabdus aquaedulcis TaxID=2211106 RepID=UPI000FD98551|nr:lipopolysaccharide heptosyltransferase I [Thiomicrorhabdus aquaedulcis]